MKRTIIVIAVIALVAVAVFGGQALAAKPTGSSVVMETLDGYFFAYDDYPDGFAGRFVDESYPEPRHVIVTIRADSFDMKGNDIAVLRINVGGAGWINLDSSDRDWEDPQRQFKTLEFVADSWEISLVTTPSSNARYAYGAVVTYPR